MIRQSNLLADAPPRLSGPDQAKRPASYLDLYGLSRPPFSGSGAHESGRYVLFTAHRPAFERLVDHMVNGRGLAILSGEEGAGKSEMLAAAGQVATDSGLLVITPPRPTFGRLDRSDLTACILRNTGSHDVMGYLLASPRTVLLLDDAALLTGDCITMIEEALAQKADGLSIVITTNVSQASHGEQSRLSRLARIHIQLPRLGPAEVREYVERALWMSGGTIRRLIAPDALRLIVAQSKGLPGSINRLMEACLTAAFVRDEPLITAATVTATLAAPVKRMRKSRPSRGAAIFHWAAFGLLLAGIVAFLYQGLTHATEAPVPPAAVIALMKNGDMSLVRGDVEAARLYFQQAAQAGSPLAATAVAKTYDPAFQTAVADPAKAVDWYRRAISLGDAEATDLMNRLTARTPGSTAP